MLYWAHKFYVLDALGCSIGLTSFMYSMLWDVVLGSQALCTQCFRILYWAHKFYVLNALGCCIGLTSFMYSML